MSTVSGLRRATLPVAGFATGAAETAAGAASDRTAAVERERDKPGNIAFQRPLCPYPQVARYKGSGSTSDEANFVCTAGMRNRQ